MALPYNLLFIILTSMVLNSNQNLVNNASAIDDMLKEFKTTLKSMNFEKIGSDFASDADDLLNYTLGLTNEDKDLDGFQLLTKYGFTYQVYTVETSDGYLLEVVRIPDKGPTVLMVHGLLSSWEDFITPGPNYGLAYLLSRRGFDVWLLNCRGNKFSRKHISLSPEKIEFWNFSWHEIGTRDIPATVDKILAVTGKQNIIYIGHSQGTTAGFVWLSEYPKYNSVVTLMICLAPVGYLDHVKSPVVRGLVPIRDEVYFIFNTLTHGELLPREGIMKILREQVCSSTVAADFICSNILFVLMGFDFFQLNLKNFLVEFSHVPSGSSIKQVIHYLQEIASGKFRQFDYGIGENLKVYKSEEPPNYNLSNIVAPIAFYYGANDWLADSIDVEKLSKELTNLVEYYLVPFVKFNHLDFLWARDVIPLLYDRVFQLLEKYTL